MKINVTSVHFDADKKLLDFINKKVVKLQQFDERILGAEIILKLENNMEQGNKIVEIRLEVPGNDLFARRQSKTFEEAVTEAIDALRNQVIKTKEKKRS
ncbi:MAG: ribosome-associated translation inhibitor RaiA [Bacteroidales bacterium]|jgi:putative sigma-54 modulation protein|nr:ribosome-associated translation inhibitor RaiA [Bacteroidales bacterium]